MGSTPPPPYAPAAPAAGEKKADEKKEEKAEEKEAEEAGAKEEKKAEENPNAPPQLDEGVSYMFDTGHTMLHIFNKAAPVWEEKYQKQELCVFLPPLIHVSGWSVERYGDADYDMSGASRCSRHRRPSRRSL